MLLVGHNIKFDLKFVNYWWGVPIPKARNIHDTMIMSFLINENTANDLKSLACIMTDLGDYEFELERWKKEYCKKNKIKISEFSYGYVPFDVLTPYALTDTDATFRIWLQLKEQVKEEGQVDVFNMLMRFTYTTCQMELRGWPVDLEYAHKYLKELEEKIITAEADLLKEPVIKQAEKILGVLELQKVNAKRKTKLAALPVPFQFNIRSTAQKSLLFFDVMGLPKIKFTKSRDADGKRTTPSTDKEVMEQWSFDIPKVAPFLEKIKQCAELCKMKSTYVEGIIKKTVNGRIHPSYNVIGAKTGRLSSRNPRREIGVLKPCELRETLRAIA
jgi:DNA polymerase I-like protein with 3'-5' exonuclease and polymerase domains